MVRPSGEKAMERMPWWAQSFPVKWLSRVASSLWEAVSHSLMVPSSPAVARVLPSGEKAMERAACERPCRVARSWPLAASQSLVVRSQLPEAMVWP